MIAILEKYDHNTDFHQIVDFVEASHLRIETTDEGTKILATVDGKLGTISESSIRRNLKLKDEAGISSLPDAELFENLTLMGYNILPNQKFSFQKGQFSYQWKYLIHTIMQCLSSKNTGFNEFSSNIATALVCLATNRVYNFSKIIFDGIVRNVNNRVSKFLMYPRVNSPSFSRRTVPLFPSMLVTMGEGLGTPTEPHHTPSPKAQQTSLTATSSPSLPPVNTVIIPTVIPFDTPQIRQYTRRARIAQSSALPPVADEPASPQGEACLTNSGLEAEQDRANITKTSTLPSDSTPRVTSLAADEGSMQQKLNELTNLCTRLQRQQDEMALKITAQDLEISQLKARVRLLEDREGGAIERSTEKGSNDTEEMVNVLTFLDATTVLSSGVSVSISPVTEVSIAEVPTGSGSIPTASPPGTGVSSSGVSTGNGSVPTASLIFTTATVATPYTRRKEMERDAQRMNEQIIRDAEIARIHAEEELHIMIDGLDMNNESVAKYLQEYYQFAGELPIEERIELISNLVKYQDNCAKVLKYQIQQRKPISRKQQKEFYMSVLKSHAGWKARHFKGMTLEEIKEKFDPVWKQIQDFIPIGSKEESERFKRKGIRLEQDGAKKVKISEEVSEEDLKALMPLVLVEEVYVQALQVKHPIIDWEHFDREDLNQLWALVKETLNIRQATSDKEKELWVELKRLYEPDVEDLLWTHTQNMMHALVEWKLYDTCGVHHVISKDQEMFMLVEKDYPLRKGLAIVMISYKLQVENYSQMANDLILKIHKIANSPRQQDD
nr:synaptobrevin, longin-like domain protein [Tanacetum cinerariifolium]